MAKVEVNWCNSKFINSRFIWMIRYVSFSNCKGNEVE